MFTTTQFQIGSQFNTKEKNIALALKRLKEEAGSHSPSIATIRERIPDLVIKIDACFLSNPYATELFSRYLKKEIIDTAKLSDLLEFYPSQNQIIAGNLASYLRIDKSNIFIGNGAIEVIQAVIHNFTRDKIIVNIPTFSSYYEFVKPQTKVIFYPLLKEQNFNLNVNHYVNFVSKEEPGSIVIINPNNPDGGYIKRDDLGLILEQLKFVENIIVDESFIHFAYEEASFGLQSVVDLIKKYPNLIVIKSMSKDFGIAGIRSGYGVMASERVSSLLGNGYLWNSNGLSEYFFKLYVRSDFQKEYEQVRIKYIKETEEFINELNEIKQIKVYPGMANFVLIELLDGYLAEDLFTYLLIKHGIYTRICKDKIGLDGEFLRIASRGRMPNLTMIKAIGALFDTLKSSRKND